MTTVPAKRDGTRVQLDHQETSAPPHPGQSAHERPLARRWTLRARSTRVALDGALLFAVVLGTTTWVPLGTSNPVLIAALASITMVALGHLVGVYSIAASDWRAVSFRRDSVMVGASAAIFLLWAYITQTSHDHAWLPAAAGAALVGLGLRSAVWALLESHVRTRHHFATRIALLGDAHAIAEFDALDHEFPGCVVVERVHLKTYDDVRPALRQADQLVRKAERKEIDRVLLLTTAPGQPVVNAVVRRCGLAGLGVDLLSGATRVRPRRLEVGRVHGFATVHVRPGLHGRGNRAFKRAFDLVTTSALLVAFAPVMAVTALAVKLDSHGPVFYRQNRLGRGGKQFAMIKFRSMVPDADELVIDLSDENEADGPLFKIKDDPRITRVGKFIRRTSIDELPQLWNVLRGGMSLVGPRPALAHEADGWPIELFDRLEVAPGITGLWQVRGRSNASFADYQRLDLYYVDNWTFGLDLRILASTVPATFGRGAY